MKSISKKHMLEYAQIDSTHLEKKILMNVDNPFIVDLLYSFNTTEKINFMMPFFRGGDMFNLM